MNKTQATKQFSENFLDLKEAEKTTFSRIVNKLLQVNLLTKRKIADANELRFILAFKEIFEAFFLLMDFSFKY